MNKLFFIAFVAILALAAGAAAKEEKDKPLKVEAKCGNNGNLQVLFTNPLSERIKTTVKAITYSGNFKWDIDLKSGQSKKFVIDLLTLQDEEIEVYLKYKHGMYTFKEELTVPACRKAGTPIPEFPTIALPIAAVIGALFFFRHNKSG